LCCCVVLTTANFVGDVVGVTTHDVAVVIDYHSIVVVIVVVVVVSVVAVVCVVGVDGDVVVYADIVYYVVIIGVAVGWVVGVDRNIYGGFIVFCFCYYHRCCFGGLVSGAGCVVCVVVIRAVVDGVVGRTIYNVVDVGIVV